MALSKKNKALQDSLKPCPFDGGKAIFTEDGEGFDVVACTSCDAQMSRCINWEDVVESWNKRVTDAKQD